MDGAKYSRASNFCILSFTILDGDEFNQASMYTNLLMMVMQTLLVTDVHVIAAMKASEEYETIAEGMKTSLDKINRFLKDPHLVIDGEVYDIEIFLCSDYKVR